MLKDFLTKAFVIQKCPVCKMAVRAHLSPKELQQGTTVACQTCGAPVIFSAGNEVSNWKIDFEALKLIGWKKFTFLLGIWIGGSYICVKVLYLNIWLSIILTAIPLIYHWIRASITVLARRFGSS